MKKNYSLKSVLVLSSLILAPLAMANPLKAPLNIIANPVGVPADIVCPSTLGSSNVLTNFGSYIAGFGTESILSVSNAVYFKSNSLPDEMPRKLVNYFNEAADYDSTTGKVTCRYASNGPTDPRFSVYYTLTNGTGGVIQGQSSNSISLLFQVGFHG